MGREKRNGKKKTEKGKGKGEKGKRKREKKNNTLLVFQDLRYPVHWIDKYFLSELRNFFFFSPRKIGNKKIVMKIIK